MLIPQVFAQTTEWSKDYCTISGVATIQGLQCLLGNVLAVAITGIGFAGFVMIVVASFQWLLSGGNSKGKETARNTITFVVVGIVVALSAFIILNLISQFTGVTTILQVIIPKASETITP